MNPNRIVKTLALLSSVALPTSALFAGYTYTATDLPPLVCQSTVAQDCSCDAKTKVQAIVQSSASRCVPILVSFPNLIPYITDDDQKTPPFTVSFKYDDAFRNTIALTTDTGEFSLTASGGTDTLAFTVSADRNSAGSVGATAITYGATIIDDPSSGATHTIKSSSRVLTLNIANGLWNTIPIGTYTTNLIYTHTMGY